jgi:hypothetical protein
LGVRLASCRELADDVDAVSHLAKLFWDLEKSNSPITLVFPWLPSPANQAKAKVTIVLHKTIARYVAMRRNAVVPANDGIDVLIADGKDDEVIIQVSQFFFCSLFRHLCHV